MCSCGAGAREPSLSGTTVPPCNGNEQVHQPQSSQHISPNPTHCTRGLRTPETPPSSRLPVGHFDGLFVGRGDQEAHRGHHGLVPRGADHLPLGSLRVVLQHALIVPADGDLQWHRQQTHSPSVGLHPPEAHTPPAGKAASPSVSAADQAKALGTAKQSSTLMSGEEGAGRQSWLPPTCWFG